MKVYELKLTVYVEANDGWHAEDTITQAIAPFALEHRAPDESVIETVYFDRSAKEMDWPSDREMRAAITSCINCGAAMTAADRQQDETTCPRCIKAALANPLGYANRVARRHLTQE